MNLTSSFIHLYYIGTNLNIELFLIVYFQKAKDKTLKSKKYHDNTYLHYMN